MTGAAHAGRATVRIRPARPDDLDAVVAIEQRAFTDPWSRKSFLSMLEERLAFFQVAEDAATGELCGYVVAWFIGGEGEIGNVAVAPERRRLGIAGELLRAALAEARRREVRELFLEVRESNEGALRLYLGHGFTAIGRRRRYYRRPEEDALVLRLQMPAVVEEGR